MSWVENFQKIKKLAGERLLETREYIHALLFVDHSRESGNVKVQFFCQAVLIEWLYTCSLMNIVKSTWSASVQKKQ